MELIISTLKKMESADQIWGRKRAEDPLILCIKLHKSQPNP